MTGVDRSGFPNRVFISYSQFDRNWSDWLNVVLREVCGVDVRYLEDRNRYGDPVIENIELLTKDCDCFLFVTSANYWASPFCRYERELLLPIWVRNRAKIRILIVNVLGPPQMIGGQEPLNLADVEDEGLAVRLIVGSLRSSAGVQHGRQLPNFTTPPSFDGPLRHKYPLDGSIVEAFDDFADRLDEQERGQQLYYELDTLKIDDGVARVPNFLIFERAGALVLAIVDEKHSVLEDTLQATYEPMVRSRLTRRSLTSLGFVHGFVHPMFTDRRNIISRILVDTVLFCQYLYMPRSKVVLPIWRPTTEGHSEKKVVSIWSFIRVLQKTHGAEKVFFASITRKGWPDEQLKRQMQASHCITRFAPTPSNSLHFGNVRSAIIPYLLARKDLSKSVFALRFDDTNPKSVSPEYVDIIRDDLTWLGFRLDRQFEFRQTDQDRDALYKDMLDLLRLAGYVKIVDETSEDGLQRTVDALDHEHPDLQFFFWLDWVRGPLIGHHVPGRLIRNEPDELAGIHTQGDHDADDANQDDSQRGKRWRAGDFSLTRTIGGDFKYKFAGLVDDLLHFSHVVRDMRQEYLTDRQAQMRFAIHRAWSNDSVAAVEIKSRLNAIRATWLGKVKRAPFTFTTPPIYIHVTLVGDREGKALQKRNLDPIYSISACRSSTVLLLPETVLSLVASTLISNADHISRIAGKTPIRRYMALQAGRLGASMFLDALAQQFSLDWLSRSRALIRLSSDDIRRQERYVIASLTYTHFRRHVDELSVNHMSKDWCCTEATLLRAYKNRGAFSSWSEIMATLAAGVPLVAITDEFGQNFRVNLRKVMTLNETCTRDEFVRVFAVASEDQRYNIEAMQDVRVAVTGRTTGPRLVDLFEILGFLEIRKRVAAALGEQI